MKHFSRNTTKKSESATRGGSENCEMQELSWRISGHTISGRKLNGYEKWKEEKWESNKSDNKSKDEDERLHEDMINRTPQDM